MVRKLGNLAKYLETLDPDWSSSSMLCTLFFLIASFHVSFQRTRSYWQFQHVILVLPHWNQNFIAASNWNSRHQKRQNCPQTKCVAWFKLWQNRWIRVAHCVGALQLLRQHPIFGPRLGRVFYRRILQNKALIWNRSQWNQCMSCSSFRIRLLFRELKSSKITGSKNRNSTFSFWFLGMNGFVSLGQLIIWSCFLNGFLNN